MHLLSIKFLKNCSLASIICASYSVDVARMGLAPPPVHLFYLPDGWWVRVSWHPSVSCSQLLPQQCSDLQAGPAELPLFGASPNDAGKWSSVSWEPNKKAANTDVKLPGLGRRKKEGKSMQPISSDLPNSPNCVSCMEKPHLETVCLSQLPPGPSETFVIMLHEIGTVPCRPWECQRFSWPSLRSSVHEGTSKRKTHTII